MTNPKWWPDEDIEKLGRMIDEGRSLRSAARALGRTPSAVIGQARRRGWSFKRPRTDEERAAPIRQVRKLDAQRRRAVLNEELVAMSVRIDRETAADIVTRANRERVSRAQIIRELIEWGLEA